jgi:hypothetical protein
MRERAGTAGAALLRLLIGGKPMTRLPFAWILFVSLLAGPVLPVSAQDGGAVPVAEHERPDEERPGREDAEEDLREDEEEDEGREDEEDLVDRAMDEPMTIHFRDTPFPVVVDYLRQATGLDIVVHQKLRAEHAETPVTLELEERPGWTVFELLGRSMDLSFEIVEGVVYLGPNRERAPPVGILQIPVGEALFEMDLMPGDMPRDLRRDMIWRLVEFLERGGEFAPEVHRLPAPGEDAPPPPARKREVF